MKVRHFVGLAVAFCAFVLAMLIKPDVAIQGQVYGSGTTGNIFASLLMAGIAGTGVWLLLGGKDAVSKLKTFVTKFREKIAIPDKTVTEAGHDAKLILKLYELKQFELMQRKAHLDDEIDRATEAHSNPLV